MSVLSYHEISGFPTVLPTVASCCSRKVRALETDMVPERHDFGSHAARDFKVRSPPYSIRPLFIALNTICACPTCPLRIDQVGLYCSCVLCATRKSSVLHTIVLPSRPRHHQRSPVTARRPILPMAMATASPAPSANGRRRKTHNKSRNGCVQCKQKHYKVRCRSPIRAPY